MNNNVKNMVDNIAASMAMEGMICTEDEKKMMEQILEGEITIDEAMQLIDEECGEFYAS